MDGVDAHAKEGRDVNIVTHPVFRCVFKVSNERAGRKNRVEEQTHIQL